MARVIVLICLLLFCFGAQQRYQASAIPILLPLTAVDFLLNAKEDLDKIKEIFSSEKSQYDEMKPVEAAMLNKLDDIVNNIDNLKSDLSLQIAHIPTKFDTQVTKLFDGIDKVQSLYITFKDIVANIKKYNPDTLKEFVKEVLRPGLNGLQAITDYMHNLLSPARFSSDTILSVLAGQNRENMQIMCGRNQSSQQIIKDLYNTVVLTDIKSVTMRRFAYDQKAIHKKTSYEFEKEKLDEGFNNRTHNTYNRIKNAMATASRDLWRCNPKTYEEDVSYSKLQEVFQKVLVFERDINEECVGECYDLKKATTSCASSFCQAEKKKNCINGKIRDCEMLSTNIDYCKSAPNSSRQFEWLKTDNGRMLGHGSSYCQYEKGDKHAEKGDPSVVSDEFFKLWRKVYVGAQTCSYCLCTCEDNDSLLDRYFSLKEVISDKEDNKVVTGIRFVKKNHVFYIQIKQGKVGTNGTIDSDEWKKVEEIKERRDDMFKNPHVFAVTYDRRTVYLDDVEDNTNNKVVTGLRFREVRNALRLDIELTEFDYATGKLGHSSWIFKEELEDQRLRLILDGSDDPIRNYEDNIHVNSVSGQQVAFRPSDVQKDLGQVTIPFLDIQEVVSNPPVPLAGAGIFHKTNSGSGGFLALKLKQYDFSSRI